AQRTPTQAMSAVFPVLPGEETDQASVMAWGFDPDQSCIDPYTGSYNAVYTSMAKLVAAGADYKKAYLSFQEFFEKLRTEPQRWGKPFAALLGTVDAQLELGAAAIGGKDSMSGTFLDLDVPPTLVSFAIAPVKAGEVLSPEFKAAGHGVYLFSGNDAESVKAAWENFHALALAGKVKAAWAVENGVSEGVMKMSFGNAIGFKATADAAWDTLMPGAIIAELTEDVACAVKLGETTADETITIGEDSASVAELLAINEGVLENIYPSKIAEDKTEVPILSAPKFERVAPKVGVATPKVLIPVFPGTNCEFDSARAVELAGMKSEIMVLANQSSKDVADSIQRFAAAARESQIIFIPGGFSGGDEPDGSAKFITAFFRNPEVRDATMDLIKNRDGLMLGVCNGFQALIKLGLVPFGEIMDTDDTCPTLTYNTIGRHQSRIVRTRIASNKSPWLAGTEVGDIYSMPISHGEGRFLCSEELLKKLAENGQIVSQYVGLDGKPSMDVTVTPNGSSWAVEGITSPDGRIFGKMGHSERVGKYTYKNVEGNYDMKLFVSAKKYFE
ncbi:MAG: phosphoribosylformylglycinamidine synthase subunit PurQ, partial [Oscillospiraceae bacterium]|nr:phosphoribosylformylglycinamidine synthase subunit PurQ [Oscillospiraceae bacterium]